MALQRSISKISDRTAGTSEVSDVSDRSDVSEVPERTTVPWREGIYDAVLVAAFGGVRWWPNKRADPVRAHPSFFFVWSFFTYAVQYTLLLCLRLNLDFKAKVRLKSPTADLLFATQMILIMVVQVSFFNILYGCWRCLLFALNPTSWYDIKRPNWRFVWLFAICSLFFKAQITAHVSSVSTSIILANHTVKHSIFDCLAIEFLLYIGDVFWEFCKTTFDVSYGRSFERRQLTVVVSSKFRVPSRLQFISSVHGGRKFEELLAAMVLIYIYWLQFFSVIYAFDTNVLPAARALCLRWNWLHGSGYHSAWNILPRLSFSLFSERLVARFYDPAPILDHYANPKEGGICTGDVGVSLQVMQRVELTMKYWVAALVFFLVMFMLLGLPALVHWLGVKCSYFRADLSGDYSEQSGDDETASEIERRTESRSSSRFEDQVARDMFS